jgi:hypothetical protein
MAFCSAAVTPSGPSETETRTNAYALRPRKAWNIRTQGSSSGAEAQRSRGWNQCSTSSSLAP